MSQRSTDPPRLPEDGGLHPVGLSPQGKESWLRKPENRQMLACFFATLTMVMYGTIKGWTIALAYQTSVTRTAPLAFENDEYLQIVSLIEFSSMIGSVVGALLADIKGRKYCLHVCGTIFIAGWVIIYFATSVRILYLARVIHGIGIGIAETTIPLYMSEVTDIRCRDLPPALITLNIHIGSLLTSTLGMFATHDSLLVILLIMSFVFLLSNTCFPETPHFLVTKGQWKKSRTSVTHYNDLIDFKIVNNKLCELRAQTRYELYSQLRYGSYPLLRFQIRQQSRSGLPSRLTYPQLINQLRTEFFSQLRRDLLSQLRRDLVSQLKTDLISELIEDILSEVHSDRSSSSRRDLSSPSRSDLPSPSRSDLLSQSIHERLSDPIQQVDTEPMPDLHLPSSSHAPATSAVRSDVIPAVHQQPRGESRLQASRDSLELPLQAMRVLYSQPESELDSQFESELHSQSESESHRHQQSTKKMRYRCMYKLLLIYASKIHQSSKRKSFQLATSEILGKYERALLQSAINEMTCKMQSRSRSDSRRQYSANSGSSDDRDEIHMAKTKYIWLTKLQVILQQSNKKALCIMFGLTMIQHLSGNYAAMQYLKICFEKAAIDIHSYHATLLVQVVSFVSVILSIIAAQYSGKRQLLLVSILGSLIALVFKIFYFYIVEEKYDSAMLIVLMFYELSYQVGIGTLSSAFLCELFPTELRGYVGAIIVIFHRTIDFTVSKLYQVISDNLGTHMIYNISAVSCFIAFITAYNWIPETKGKHITKLKSF